MLSTTLRPSNRLVAGTLEHRWNEALLQMEELNRQYAEFQDKHTRATTPEQKARVLALAQDFPRLWRAPTTKSKDRKRMLRLLVKDITVERIRDRHQAVLHLRWQGGACEDLPIELPRPMAERVRYPKPIVDRVRELAHELPDDQIVAVLNEAGLLSAKGKPFTVAMIRWIRYRYRIPAPQLKRPDELTVRQLADKLNVSPHVVYYWIGRNVIQARRLNHGSSYWITLDPAKEKELRDWVQNSTRIQKQRRKKDSESVLSRC